jgi:ABC-type multidrug transport system ATPase subunit
MIALDSLPETPADAAAHPLIRVRGLRKRYGDAWAVDGLDLDVAAGEIVGLLGPNGAGKTTALEMLCALRRPTEGTIEVAGADPVTDARAVRAQVGTVLQAPALDPVDTPQETLALQARLRGASARRAAAEADAALDRAGLADLAHARIATLSGGQRRRVDLATAVIGRPRVLILDEPTTGLDPASRKALWDHVRELAAAGLAVLLSTQDLHEADQLAHRLVVMRSGRVVANATPARLRAAAGGRTLVVTLTDAGDRPAALAIAAGAGHPASAGPSDDVIHLAVDDGPVPVDYLAALGLGGVAVDDVRIDEPSLDDAVIALTA